MSDPELGIAKTQLEASRRHGAKGLAKNQGSGIASLDERIVMSVCALGFLGLLVVWATAKSPWLLYGSLGLAILLLLFWGYARIKRIELQRDERARQADNWNRDNRQD